MTGASAALVLALTLACAPYKSMPFDWDRYDDRQAACRAYDRMLTECSNGTPVCDQATLHDLQRRCSAPDRRR